MHPASISRTHSQCQRRCFTRTYRPSRIPLSSSLEICWWSLSGSNRRPQACKASALPTELRPHIRNCMVGRVGVEPTTSRLSGVRSNHLSYRPPHMPAGHKGRGRREPAQAHSSTPVRSDDLTAKLFSRMKGHEDGGNVPWKCRRSSPIAYTEVHGRSAVRQCP